MIIQSIDNSRQEHKTAVVKISFDEVEQLSNALCFIIQNHLDEFNPEYHEIIRDNYGDLYQITSLMRNGKLFPFNVETLNILYKSEEI